VLVPHVFRLISGHLPYLRPPLPRGPGLGIVLCTHQEITGDAAPRTLDDRAAFRQMAYLTKGGVRI